MSAARRIPLQPIEEVERLRRRRESQHEDLYQLLDCVTDPEIPVLSLWDLGVLRDVRRIGDRIAVVLTPTYSGCPALAVMVEDVERRLVEAGHSNVDVTFELSPAWSSTWMSAAARDRLRAYGVAPPQDTSCPHCGSVDTQTISEFASTACKALYRCNTCREPFDYFKVI